MSDRWRSVAGVVFVTIILVVAGGVAPEPAAAAIGDFIGTPLSLKQGSADLCAPININGIGNDITGTSVAVVRGGALGLPQYRVLLVTSCLGGNSDTTRKSTIHFIDPATGTSVSSITTSFVPPRGWSALTLRPDKADFLGCVATGANTGDLNIYKISYTGSAAILVNSAIGALKGPVCDGLAWDYDTKTIYASKDGGTTVRRWVSATNNDSFTQVATDLATPKQNAANCLISALSFVDGALFVACKGLSSGALVNAGHLVNKATGPTSTGASLSSLPLFAQTITEDAECDPVTFAAQNRDALWAKNRNTNILNAFQLPGFTCGRSIGPLVAAPTQQNPNPDPVLTLVSSTAFKGPGACPAWFSGNPDADTDQDGLLDCWEQPWPGDSLPGIDFDGNGTRDVVLCVNGLCADPNRKDIFVEADSLQNHPFDAVAQQQVIDAFDIAPVPNPTVQNPTGTPGVNLHILADDGNALGSDVIAHKDFVALEPCTPAAGTADANFDQLKKSFFGTKAERNQAEPQRGKTIFAKRMAFRWALFAHDLKPPATNPGARSSGCAEIEGDDLVVTLGGVYAGAPVREPIATLTPGAISGLGVTFTASASVFAESDVGKILRGDAEKPVSGKAVILDRISATQVHANITQNFANTTPIPAGSWQLVASNPEPPAIVNGNVNDQAGTFMHEVGHTLGLRHGGRDGTNCKPNYLSVMSYARQFSDGAPLSGRRLDYSRNALATLDETALNEGAGIGAPELPVGMTDETVFAADKGTGRVVVIRPAGGNLDWNQNCLLNPALCNNADTNVTGDVNNFAFPDSDVSGCDASPGEELEGYDDWANLQYNHRASLDVASGASNEVNDPIDGLDAAFDKVDVNADGKGDGRCSATGLLWVIDIQSPVNLGQTSGGVPTTMFSQPGCPVTNLNPSTLTLTGSSGQKGFVRLKPNGTSNCNAMVDQNGDGQQELRCHFHDDGLGIGDVSAVVEGWTLPDSANPKGIGFRAKGGVKVQ